jgi:peptide deformylase
MLPIITYPNPILENPAKEVSFPLDNETKILIKNMWATVKGIGVGLAAPQVGVSKQICIIHLSEVEKGKRAKDIVMINPKIVFFSEVENEMVEGCLSFPDEFWKIWRPANIVVEFQDEKGKKHSIRATDWLSRVIQHEIDHLNGDIFIQKGGVKLKADELNHNDDIVD